MKKFNTNIVDWDKFLLDTDKELKKKGYRKFNQNYRFEDFSYWKTIKDKNENKLYQIGLLIYDMRKYIGGHYVSIEFCCLLFSEGRIEMTVSEKINVDKFEEMSLHFYQTMSNYIIKKNNESQTNSD